MIISIKADKEWLDKIEEHFEEYSWPLFTKEFIIYEHKSNVNIDDKRDVGVCFDVSISNGMSLHSDRVRLRLYCGSSHVKLAAPFWWRWKMNRKIMKLMKASLKEELKRIKEC